MPLKPVWNKRCLLNKTAYSCTFMWISSSSTFTLPIQSHTKPCNINVNENYSCSPKENGLHKLLFYKCIRITCNWICMKILSILVFVLLVLSKIQGLLVLVCMYVHTRFESMNEKWKRVEWILYLFSLLPSHPVL